MTDAWPVGRQGEYRRIVDHFDTGRSAVLLVSGPPGSGRTYLLEHVGRAALAAGLRVAGLDGSLAVTENSTVANFRMQLAAAFDPESLTGADDTQTGGVADDNLLRSGYHAVLKLLNREPEEEERVARLLDRAGPALVVLDGFSPTSPMRRWVTNRLVADVRSSEEPIVLVISGPSEDLEALREVADDVIELGDLDRDDVRLHLQQRTSAMVPPLTETELDAYAEAASERPEVMRDLTLVFDVLTRSSS